MEKLRLYFRAKDGAAWIIRSLTLVLLLLLSGCLIPGGREGAPALTVSSGAFTRDGQIPVMYTCDGANVSPPLSWTDPPPGTAGFAILVTDPDAPGGTFTHWVACNIPSGTREIPAGARGKNALPAGSVEGRNDFGRAGYGGPCPPGGRAHHYHFTVYALDTALTISGKRDGQMLQEALKGHVLAWGEITGIYSRA